MRIEERPYAFDSILIGYDSYPPPENLRVSSCKWGSSLDSMNNSCLHTSISYHGQYYQEDNWVYDRISGSLPSNLQPGEYYFNITFRLEAGYPDQDQTFSFKIYVYFREVR